MPPKKKAKATSSGASITTTRATRASTRNKPETPNSEAPSVGTPTNGKRKRSTTAAQPISVDSDNSDMEVGPVHAMKAKHKVPPKKKATPVSKVNAVQKWFQAYANPETNTIDPSTFQRWMDDLDVSSEGAFMYFILWKCNSATQMSITQEEFRSFMDSIGVKSNQQLLDKLPDLMAIVRPNKARPTLSDQFRPFYKWCFNHFRPEGQKNVPVDIAQVLFQTLLDAEKYLPTWKPPTTVNGDHKRGQTPSEFPHVNAFMEFLNTEPKPVQVITRDQYDQFYEFNSSVSWDLKEHSEDSAWPALIDNYVTWKKSNYPTTKYCARLGTV